MKNLANCKPSEFLKQTNLIRKSVEKWLTATDIMNIRKRMPENLPTLDSDMSAEKMLEATEERKKLMAEQARKNFSAILDAILDEHPDETLELLALLCFVKPKDVDKHTVSEYMTAIVEMLQDEGVLSFFTLLGQLEKSNILRA